MSIAADREQLVTALDALDATVTGYVPERVAAPAVIVTEGPLFVRPSSTFGSWTVTYDGLLLVPVGSNEAMIRALDELVDALLNLLGTSAEWDLDQVRPYELVTLNGARYLGTIATITTTI